VGPRIHPFFPGSPRRRGQEPSIGQEASVSDAPCLIAAQYRTILRQARIRANDPALGIHGGVVVLTDPAAVGKTTSAHGAHRTGPPACGRA
jgi:hypothetical protein